MKTGLAIVVLFGAVTGAACADSQPADPDPIPGLAPVQTVELRILESFPVQVHAVARGELPDPCTSIASVSQARRGFDIEVRLTTTRPRDLACIQVLAPFEEIVALDVLGLPAGRYRVEVNGVEASFVLPVDNGR